VVTKGDSRYIGKPTKADDYCDAHKKNQRGTLLELAQETTMSGRSESRGKSVVSKKGGRLKK